MEFITLKSADLTVPRIGLGTWAIGGWMWGGTDEAEAIRTIHAALDRGIRLIDTAPVYGFGRSEEIVGRALAEYGQRDKIILATKAGLDWSGDGIRRNSAPERLQQELEDSLRRLQTDTIDIYQIHWPDEGTPFEETARTLEDMRQSGKIRAVGVSNFSPEQMDRLSSVVPIATAQPPYNLFERGIEADVAPYCVKHDIGMVTYGALCRGLLSGAMSADRKFEGDDLRQNDPKFQPPRFAQYLAAVERLDQFARERFDRRVIHLALRWLIDQPGVVTALWGARRPDQLEPVDAIFGWSLTDADQAEIDRILAETVTDPVGPEFMAPPESRPAA
ncbi:aldo/keto reductase [Halothiobacillus sp.]|uniref:aldo/keto reductase n=1 Tax=Halothiobacillus sp. TaxID=1891311 RepID=UPI00260FA92A|nr:aldo/keto reductase [Halothiobacillus sp.]